MKKIIFLALVLVAPVCSAAYENTCGTQCQDDFGLHLTSEQKQQEMSVCEALGYSSTANCSEGYIVCPFDSNYIWCKIVSILLIKNFSIILGTTGTIG